ncbi:hypothetical protein F383_22431 [Gossypium arboreum]|uniref:Uncharacterized protein n=1 Tax=Gossypium arboreum TaxID=29729 RepID=A0A0B0NXL9_GOSAR|nr:hypothetical protein F383_22431 [Gossypium arboreum]
MSTRFMTWVCLFSMLDTRACVPYIL